MKTKFNSLFIALALLACVDQAVAQGTAFTYQGRLQNNGSPASGIYNLTFTLFNTSSGTSSGGSLVAGPVTNNAVVVTSGLFTVQIDFGAGVFAGSNNWLEIAVRTNGSGSFNTLTPRQQLTPMPYAIIAENLAAVSQFNTVVPGEFATVGGGANNIANGPYATVSGGQSNNASGPGAFIGGGGYDGTVLWGNIASGAAAVIAGGVFNTASGEYATVSGGWDNIASSQGATVAGGVGNTANGESATVAGGGANTASGQCSFAAGYYAQALNDGSFVWADDTARSFASTAPNQFSVRAAGGIVLAGDVQIEGGASTYHHVELSGGNSTGFLYGSYPAFPDEINLGYNYYADNLGATHIPNAGGGTSRISTGYGEVTLSVGAANTVPYILRLDATTAGVAVYGTFNNSSDRNAKQDFAPVSSSEILNKVLRLPVSEWSYKTDSATRHIGPMGQDFYSVFNIGTDEKHIAPIDEGGVALAAIQGLNQKLNEKDVEIQNLEKKLDALQAVVKQLAARK
jgi:hypothetical protein